MFLSLALIGDSEKLRKLITIVFKSEKELYKANKQKKTKSDNFTRYNNEKYNIAIAILEKLIIG